eukprot:3115805-Alexandrium_andersonii.AAC.1
MLAACLSLSVRGVFDVQRKPVCSTVSCPPPPQRCKALAGVWQSSLTKATALTIASPRRIAYTWPHRIAPERGRPDRHRM